MEGEVGRLRRRHLVPVPRVASLAELNALLAAADRAADARHIAGRLETVGAMAAAERPALRSLPAEPFDSTLPLRARLDRKAHLPTRLALLGSPPLRRSGGRGATAGRDRDRD